MRNRFQNFLRSRQLLGFSHDQDPERTSGFRWNDIELHASNKKLSIASRNVGYAGSYRCGTWFSDSRTTNLAFGIDVAMRRPSSKGMRLSWRQCMTNVGADTLGNRLTTSISSKVPRSLTVFSGDDAIRCNSASHRTCSADALGRSPVHSIF